MLTIAPNLLCALDTESTGLVAGYHDLIQVALVPLDENLDAHPDITPFYMNIRPLHPERAHPRAMEVNGLDLEELSHAPTAFQVADCFDEWFESLDMALGKKIIYLTQNAPHDLPFLKHWLGDEGYNKYFHRRGRDTMFTAIAKNDEAAWKNRPIPFKWVGLKQLAEHFGIPFDGHHDALCDSLVTAKIYKELLRME